jgi:hypothetical protein
LIGNVMMKLSITFSVAISVGCLALASSVGATEENARSAGSAKAAAHASLLERADVPREPPRLPDGLGQPPRRHGDNAPGKKAQAERKAEADAQEQVDNAAHGARADAANRAAQGSAAAAAHNNDADERAAAGQARAAAARARAGKPTNPGNSGNAPGKQK